MINSPSNPTGVVYERRELEALADVVLEADLGVLSDEIYEDLTYGDARPTCFATLRPGMADRTITVSGVSKTYAMTGWRIGWSVAPVAVSKFIGDLQSQETSNPCSISQWAALEAITGPREAVIAMREKFAERRDYVLERVRRLPGVTCLEPGGAFYVFMNVSTHFGRTFGDRKVVDSTSFCLAALDQAHVALVMGSAFGAEGHARLSFAAALSQIARGFDALEAFLQA
jgi:aspartate aminotransferase